MELESNQLKAVVKEAVLEALQQHPELVSDAVAEALEDVAMARAIEEGNPSDLVSRDEVLAILGEE